MNRRVLTTAAAVGATLVLGVPTAWGSGEPLRDHGDATQARLVMQPDPMIEDGFAQAVAAHAKLVAQSSPGVEIVRDHGDATQAKLTPERSSETSSAEQTPSLSSGGEIEWSQLAIGALVGTIFAFGLVFLVRLTRSRTLAH